MHSALGTPVFAGGLLSREPSQLAYDRSSGLKQLEGMKQWVCGSRGNDKTSTGEPGTTKLEQDVIR
jgi:hypothetical protein